MTVEQEATHELIELPREGYRLFWNAERHVYQRINDKGKPGKWFTGVSTIAKALPDSPDGLMAWTEKLTFEGMARLIRTKLDAAEKLREDGLEDQATTMLLDWMGAQDDPQVLRAALETHGLRWKQIRDEAGRRGTRVHELMLEALAKGEQIPDLAELPADERGYGQAMFRFWNDWQPEPLQVEQIVLSIEGGFAGRFDLRAKFNVPLMTGVGLGDAKTGKSLRASDHAQLRGYDRAAKECGIGGSDFLFLLHLKPGGTYEVVPCAATDETFSAALASYRAKAEVEKAIRKASK